MRGHRVENGSDSDIKVVADAMQIEPIIVAPLLAIPVLLILLLWVLLSGRKKK